MNLATPLREYFESLVHPSARLDSLRMTRHRNFIASRLLVGFFGIAMLPLCLVAQGALARFEILTLAWFLAPIAIGYFVSATGRIRDGYILWSFTLACLLAGAAVAVGGFTVGIAVWLILVPLEAAFGASRRAVFVSTVVSITACLFILAATPQSAWSFLPNWWDAAAVVAAIAYASMLAFNAELFARTSSTLLAREGERYALLASSMTDVITRHGAGGAVLFASPAAQYTFGANPDDLIGHGIFDLVHVADRPIYLSALAAAAAGQNDLSAEFRIRRNVSSAEASAAGQFRWLEMRCRPLSAEVEQQGNHEVVAVMRDITARKSQQEAVVTARREAEAANEAKGRFLAMMSHELRTPLNAVIGFSDMLVQERALGLDAEKRLEYAGLIKTSGEHLLAVVNQVLDLSKIESGTLVVSPEQCEPAPVVRGCCDLLALKAHEGGLEIQLSVDPRLSSVVIDQRALKQMAINLISNAIKFTRRGGRVKVRVGLDRDMFVLGVEDSGIGIAAEDLRQLGSPFYQAQPTYDRRYEGTGLGLSIVKGLAELHDGRLDISSTVGVGTHVRVLLPRNGPAPAPKVVEKAGDVVLLEPQHRSEPTKVKQSA